MNCAFKNYVTLCIDLEIINHVGKSSHCWTRDQIDRKVKYIIICMLLFIIAISNIFQHFYKTFRKMLNFPFS